MYKLEVMVNNNGGLHARPVSLFVKESNRFKSHIKVIKNGNEYNGKSMINIFSMGAIKGDILTIVAEGEDEKEAVEALVELAKSKFDEE